MGTEVYNVGGFIEHRRGMWIVNSKGPRTGRAKSLRAAIEKFQEQFLEQVILGNHEMCYDSINFPVAELREIETEYERDGRRIRLNAQYYLAL